MITGELPKEQVIFSTVVSYYLILYKKCTNYANLQKYKQLIKGEKNFVMKMTEPGHYFINL
jgi:hypothetical protein